MATERQQEALILRNAEHLTYREIGQRLGVTGGRASQLCRAASRQVINFKRDPLLFHLTRMSAARLGG